MELTAKTYTMTTEEETMARYDAESAARLAFRRSMKRSLRRAVKKANEKIEFDRKYGPNS
jgi:hypothetical protein